MNRPPVFSASFVFAYAHMVSDGIGLSINISGPLGIGISVPFGASEMFNRVVTIDYRGNVTTY